MDRDFDVFWGEMSPCDHSVQIYGTDEAFLDALEGFVARGLHQGESAIVIATPEHRTSLRHRLHAQGLDLDEAAARDQYISLDAEATLAEFMRASWPDDGLFAGCVARLIARARTHGRSVRAFGEMVAILWAQGHSGATVRLEHLWHQVCREHAFPLFCAYPRTGFTQNASASLEEICATHDRLLGGIQ
jgi:hypothetical protein